jgi:hypothetical protein
MFPPQLRSLQGVRTGHRCVGAATPAATDDDLRFLQYIGSIIEAQTNLVKRSVIALAESRELLAKINDLLRR